jgi:hypothetical protein
MRKTFEDPRLDRHFKNRYQCPGGDEWTERNLLRMSPEDFRFLLDMAPVFLYRISMPGLLKVCGRSPSHLQVTMAAIGELLSGDDGPELDGAAHAWDGIKGPMTRRAWLEALRQAIEGHQPCAGTRLEPAPEYEQALSTSLACEKPKGEGAALEWYLPSVPPGQFLLPHLMTCGSVVRIGVRNEARVEYSAESPLHVLDFSGQRYGDTVVSFVGEELRTGDMEVWGQLLKLAAPLPLGSRVLVSARQLLKALGRGTGGPAYKSVRAEISRLQRAQIRVRSSHEAMREQFRAMFPDDPLSAKRSTGPVEVSFQLLGPSSTDGQTWSVAIPREVRVAFGPRLSSWFSERDYSTLTRRREGDTVKRLFLLYRSHARPWPFTLQELRNFLGSTMSRDSDLRVSLDNAHDRLTQAGLIKAWRYGLTQRRRNCCEKVYEVDF